MVYYVLIVPYMIIFDNYSDYFSNFEIFLDSYFILDIIINFFTTYRDERGYYVYSFSQIAVNYLKSYFTIDLLTSIPLSRMLDN